MSVDTLGLAAAPYLGAAVVAGGIGLTRLSGRLDRRAGATRPVAAE